MATACLPAAAPGPQPPGGLALQDASARHTQEWVALQLTGTAGAAQHELATEAAGIRATEQAMAVRQTETAEQLAATRQAGTTAADLAAATSTAGAAAMAATATQSSLFATATVQSARAGTVATQEAAEQRRVEMTTSARALIPWVILLAVVAVLLVIIAQAGQAAVRRLGVIRQANGDVHTILLDANWRELRTVNPEKSIDPVLRLLPGSVEGAGGAGPAVQFQLAQNEQMLRLAREYVQENRRITDPRKIEELKTSFAASRPPVLVHPHYGIDPLSLPEIPLFDVGSRLLSGGSRSGKTNLAQYDLYRMEVVDLAVFDPKYRPGKWPAHAQVLTKPGELLERLRGAQTEFENRRDNQVDAWVEQSGPHVTVIDEYTALVELAKLSGAGPEIHDAIAMAWALVMYGTEFGVAIWILSQTSNAASLGLSGRGDFRDSLTRIAFEWRPKTLQEMEIPRIAEVAVGDRIEKYLVPRWSPTSPGDSPRLSQPIPNEQVAYLREHIEAAGEFNDEDLALLIRMHAEGASGNAIRSRLGRNRSWIYELLGGLQRFEEEKQS